MKKRLPLYLISAIIGLFLVIWAASLIHCEILTCRHSDTFDELCRSNTMIGEPEYLKVLHYNSDTAEIYFVSEDHSAGCVLKFEQQNDIWTETAWDCIWSTSGSASGAVWPYWWQIFITGV